MSLVFRNLIRASAGFSNSDMVIRVIYTTEGRRGWVVTRVVKVSSERLNRVFRYSCKELKVGFDDPYWSFHLEIFYDSMK